MGNSDNSDIRLMGMTYLSENSPRNHCGQNLVKIWSSVAQKIAAQKIAGLEISAPGDLL